MNDTDLRALDAQVAEKLMGWKVWESKYGYFNIELPDGETMTSFFGVEISKFDSQTGKKLAPPSWWQDCDTLPYYSTDIAAAFQVVERMRELGYFPYLWAAQMWNIEFWADEEKCLSSSNEDSLPLAICKAASEAVNHYSLHPSDTSPLQNR